MNISVQLFCNHDSMTVSLNTADPFNGKLYAKEEPMACESTGRSTTNTMLTMPFSPRTECGIREDVSPLKNSFNYKKYLIELNLN